MSETRTGAALRRLLLPSLSFCWSCNQAAVPSSVPAQGCYPAFAAACWEGVAVGIAYEDADVVVQPDAVGGDFTRCPISEVVFEIADIGEKIQQLESKQSVLAGLVVQSQGRSPLSDCPILDALAQEES